MYKLKIINSTVRPGRKGPLVTAWIERFARLQPSFETEILDLAAINLPMMNEVNHPMLRAYEHQYTKDWSAQIDAADAFIFVTAEYDYNYPAPLRNALEYLVHEWGYKAAGLVSYGGMSAGTRASNALKSDLASLRVVPLPESVHFPFFQQYITGENDFVPGETAEKSAALMFKQLLRWTKGLQTIRENKE